MSYDEMLIKHKLHRWEAYLDGYSLPDWIDIPDMGLYMDQLVGLLSHYLNFIPLVDGSQKPITPSTINNYVRLKVMPAPHKRKYYRIHIAYLIMIFTLKQSVSIACVQQLLPWNLTEAQTCGFYATQKLPSMWATFLTFKPEPAQKTFSIHRLQSMTRMRPSKN